MNALRTATIVLVIFLSVSGRPAAQPPPSEAASGKQEIQKRVRSMARQLLTGILDVQLRQSRWEGKLGKCSLKGG